MEHNDHIALDNFIQSINKLFSSLRIVVLIYFKISNALKFLQNKIIFR